MKFRQSLVPTSLALGCLVQVVACSSDEAGQTTASNTTTATSTATSTATLTSTSTSTSTSNATITSSVASTSGTTSTVSTAMTSTSSSAATTGTVTASSASTSSNSSSSAGGASSSSSSSSSSSAGGAGGTSGTAFALTSPAFTDSGDCSTDTPDNCEFFPLVNSSFGDNQNPELNWTAGPAGTMGYALVMHDLSNTFGHWAIWNLSADTLQLPAGLPGDAMLTTPVSGQQASLGQGNGYFGPGSCMNVYEFKVYALSEASFSPGNATNPSNIRDALDASPAVLATATLRARANPEDSPQSC